MSNPVNNFALGPHSRHLRSKCLPPTGTSPRMTRLVVLVPKKKSPPSFPPPILHPLPSSANAGLISPSVPEGGSSGALFAGGARRAASIRESNKYPDRSVQFRFS